MSTTKESIGKIISANRRPFAVHQIWAEFNKLECENAVLRSRANATPALHDDGKAELVDSLRECIVAIEHRASREELECTVERARAVLARHTAPRDREDKS